MIALVEDGDRIEIDIPNLIIKRAVSVLAERRKAMEERGNAASRPAIRNRNVSPALKAYAALATSAARLHLPRKSARIPHSACILVRLVT